MSPQQQIPLEIPPGVLAAIMVVMGICWFDAALDRRENRPPGHAFGAWTLPEIRSPMHDQARSSELGLQLKPAAGFAYFLVDRPDDGKGPTTLSFINRKALLVGEITLFDSAVDPWPPESIAFGPAVNLDAFGDDAAETPGLDLGPLGKLQLQVQAVLYDNVAITWAAPRKCPSWPLRVHIGKCELGPRTYRITVYELDAKTATPDYQDGPIGDLARVIAPL